MGAPSSATATVGTVSAVYVQNRPTIRINTLNARFMGSFSFVRVPWERKPLCARNYTARVKTCDIRRALWVQLVATASVPDGLYKSATTLYSSLRYDLLTAKKKAAAPFGKRDSECLKMRQIRVKLALGL